MAAMDYFGKGRAAGGSNLTNDSIEIRPGESSP
jgi:hypothetical protein